jgi:hypothetical protein
MTAFREIGELERVQISGFVCARGDAIGILCISRSDEIRSASTAFSALSRFRPATGNPPASHPDVVFSRDLRFQNWNEKAATL